MNVVAFKQYWQLLVTYVKPQWIRALGMGILLLSSLSLQLINPLLLRFFIDQAMSQQPLKNLVMDALLFIAVALAAQITSVCATYLSTNVGWISTNALRTDLARHCLQLDMTFHNAHTPGEMIERLDGDVTILSNFFSKFVVQLLGNILLILGVLLLLFGVDWRAGWAVAAFVSFAAFVLGKLRKIAIPYWAVTRQLSAEFYSFLEEQFGGTEDIRSNGAVPYILQRFIRLVREQLRAARKSALITSVTINASIMLMAIGIAVSFSVGAYLFNAHMITVGTVYLIYYYTLMLNNPISLITEQLDDFQKVGASVDRIQQIYNIQPTIHGGPGVDWPSEALSVEFQNVSFSYSKENILLQNISFNIPAGKILGLLGRTGSGKTTITRLLLRLYNPVAGTIRVGGKDICDARLAELRQHIGMVTQDIQFFQATVRDNLTLFQRTITDDQILNVIKNLGLWEWYDALPDGLDTEFTSEIGLSAGQSQLLAFARVFLKDPGLVILDEASSRLDPVTEQLIEHAMETLLQGRTAIIIAHHLTTINRADEIMIIENGQIREMGARDQLAKKPATRFYQLLHSGEKEVF